MGIPVLSFANNKGGVAKTTCLSLMGEYGCLIKKKRVLMIDFDSQMNLSIHWIGCDTDDIGSNIALTHPEIDENNEEDMQYYSKRSNISDIFYGKGVLPHPTYLGKDNANDDEPRVDIISSCYKSMYDLQVDMMSRVKKDMSTKDAKHLISRLAEFCSSKELENYYDLILIDTSPFDSPLFRAVIKACTKIVIPYKPEEFSLTGITTLINNIYIDNSHRGKDRENIDLIGILPTIVDKGRTGLHTGIIKEASKLKNHFPENLFISNSQKISSRQSRCGVSPNSVFDLKPSDPVRKECFAVFEYIYNRTFNIDANEGAAA